MKKKINFPFVDDNFYFLLLATFHRRGNLVLESEKRGEENLTPTFWKKYGTQRFQRRRELVFKQAKGPDWRRSFPYIKTV